MQPLFKVSKVLSLMSKVMTGRGQYPDTLATGSLRFAVRKAGLPPLSSIGNRNRQCFFLSAKGAKCDSLGQRPRSHVIKVSRSAESAEYCQSHIARLLALKNCRLPIMFFRLAFFCVNLRLISLVGVRRLDAAFVSFVSLRVISWFALQSAIANRQSAIANPLFPLSPFPASPTSSRRLSALYGPDSSRDH